MPDAFTWNHDAPLTRAKGETAAANQALTDYARMGIRRSLRKLLERYQGTNVDANGNTNQEPPTRSFNTITAWNFRYAWQARVARFDELEKEESDRLWEERRIQLLEEDWNQGQDLREKASQFLEQLPRFITTNETETRRTLPNGQTEVVRVVTVGLNASLTQIAQALRTGSELMRLATNQPTDDIRLSGAALDAAIARELEALANLREAGLPAEDTGAADGGTTED